MGLKIDGHHPEHVPEDVQVFLGLSDLIDKKNAI